MTSIFGVNLETADNVSKDDVNESLKSYLKIDGSVEMKGTLNLGVNKISRLAYPEADADAATKYYVDQVPHYVEIGYVKSDSYEGLSITDIKSVSFFSADLLSGKSTKLTRADVIVDLKPVPSDDHLARIYELYAGGNGTSKMYLDIIIDGDTSSFELNPITSGSFSIPLNLELSSMERYNAKLTFTYLTGAQVQTILNIASLRLIHGRA